MEKRDDDENDKNRWKVIQIVIYEKLMRDDEDEERDENDAK